MAEPRNIPKNMTVVGGVRVRKEDEDTFRTRHKAVLAPRGGQVTAAAPKKATRSRKVEAGGDESTD